MPGLEEFQDSECIIIRAGSRATEADDNDTASTAVSRHCKASGFSLNEAI